MPKISKLPRLKFTGSNIQTCLSGRERQLLIQMVKCFHEADLDCPEQYENLFYYERLWQKLHGFTITGTKYDFKLAGKTECDVCGKEVSRYRKDMHKCRPKEFFDGDWETLERIGRGL